LRRRADRLALVAIAILLAALPAAHFRDDPRQLGPFGVSGVDGRSDSATVDEVAQLPGGQFGVAQSVSGAPELSGDSVIAPPPETFDAPAEPAAPPPESLQKSTFSGVPKEGGVWAVVIGVNDYPGSRSDLRSAVNDARDVVQALAGFGVGGHRVLQIEDRQASADVIRAALDWLVAHSATDATSVFFYAGHVRKVATRTEAIVAADGSLVTDAEVAERLRPLESRNVWLGMATCYGGGFTEVLAEGRVLTAAAGANSLAYENESFGRSYLVQYMVRKAMIERHAPSSVQAAYEWAWHAIARDYPHRTPVQIDQAGAPLSLGTSASTPPSPQQPAQPSAPPPSGGGESPPSTAPPEDEDDSCGGVRVGSLIDCSPD